MHDISDQSVAYITVASACMQFFKANRVGPNSPLIRVSPDIMLDIVGEEEFKRRVNRGTKNTIFGIQIVVDPEMNWGTCTIGWKL